MSLSTIRNFVATKAVLKHNGKILLLRESQKYKDGTQTGRYDVPGGRINPYETLLDGLKREIFEETGLAPLTHHLFFKDNVIVQRGDEEWHIERNYFACDADADTVILSDDHDVYLWIDPQDFASVTIIDNLHEVFAAYLKLDQ